MEEISKIDGLDKIDGIDKKSTRSTKLIKSTKICDREIDEISQIVDSINI